MPVTKPAPTAPPGRNAKLWMAAFVVGLVVVGVVMTTSTPPSAPREGLSLPRLPPPPADVPALLRRLGVGSVAWFACALWAPAFWWLAWRVPLSQHRSPRSLATHLGLVAAAIFVTCVAHFLVAYRGSSLAPAFSTFFPVALGANAVPLLAVAALANGAEVRRRALRSVLEAQRLRAELAESRLAAVTAQLQPHFLFNTLQGISTLIHRDPLAADRMLVQLSDLLREVLRRSRHSLVPLGDELRMTGTYLDLARVRYGDRLRVVIDADEATRGALVPVLLLQPLVENALTHGIGPRATGGTVGITTRRSGNALVVTVWDDGEGPGRSIIEGTGVGNTRERLRVAFGDEQALELGPRSGGGTEVIVRLPVRFPDEGAS
ncbi:MAG: histidine kinase [Cytophagaceae bacterium]|nr:histidine kinase [Gemmatimonadaceae bacterium]